MKGSGAKPTKAFPGRLIELNAPQRTITAASPDAHGGSPPDGAELVGPEVELFACLSTRGVLEYHLPTFHHSEHVVDK